MDEIGADAAHVARKEITTWTTEIARLEQERRDLDGWRQLYLTKGMPHDKLDAVLELLGTDIERARHSLEVWERMLAHAVRQTDDTTNTHNGDSGPCQIIETIH